MNMDAKPRSDGAHFARAATADYRKLEAETAPLILGCIGTWGPAGGGRVGGGG